MSADQDWRAYFGRALAAPPDGYAIALKKEKDMTPASCTGSPETCTHCRAILSETPHQASRRLRQETRGHFHALGLTPPPDTDDTPTDPYHAALSSRANERRDVLNDPQYWPNYQPKGHAPDGYALHLALRALDREDAEETNR